MSNYNRKYKIFGIKINGEYLTSVEATKDNEIVFNTSANIAECKFFFKEDKKYVIDILYKLKEHLTHKGYEDCFLKNNWEIVEFEKTIKEKKIIEYEI